MLQRTDGQTDKVRTIIQIRECALKIVIRRQKMMNSQKLLLTQKFIFNYPFCNRALTVC